ncbi:c-type cytochrome [Curvivirga aplysinae]|uniref:c-type cytochrome n=1 Tax=Curvivirga aplysinae TaxID=2529852 RepID=UPI001C3FC400|nr:cytochrome c [Curvivirga aplysinae]
MTTSAEEIKTSGGTAMEQSEIDKWSITIYPDGRNLPDGSGTAKIGKPLYEDQCVDCHGVDGDKGIAPRLVGQMGYQEWNPHPLLALTVAAWPNTTTIFDYIRRGMPHHSPKTLSDSDVYALTAYILHLNNLIGENDVLDRETLKEIEMPYKDKSFSAWDLEEGGEIRGKPLNSQ